MSLYELLQTIVEALEHAGIPHMVAGSIASTFHGEPRMTQDVDLVIDPDAAALQAFVDSLDRSRFYVGDAPDALARRDQFNIIDTSSGWKVDLIIRKDRPFSRSEFERRLATTIAGVTTAVATIEDTILAKLEWGRSGGSERQVRDVVGMLVVSGDSLDNDYLLRWANELGVTEELARAREMARLR